MKDLVKYSVIGFVQGAVEAILVVPWAYAIVMLTDKFFGKFYN